MAFKQVGSVGGDEAPILKHVILANSITSIVGQALIASSGFAALGTTGTLVLGHLRAHTTKNGVGLETTGVAGAASGSYVGTYLTASDNQTVGMVKAEVDVSKDTLYSVDPDATIATTTGSNLLGYHTDIADASTTDESTAATTTAQYTIWGVDPEDSGNQVVSIYESVVFGV